MTTRRSGASLFIIVLLLATGCQRRPAGQPEVGQVTGKITLDGEPLTDGIVYFIPPEGRSSVGNTDKNGVYVMGYLPKVLGARLGKHKVVIKTYWPDETSPEALSAVDKIPKKYNSETTLTAEVKAGKNTINFELTKD